MAQWWACLIHDLVVVWYPIEANPLFPAYFHLSLLKHVRKSGQLLWKESSVSTCMWKPGNTCASLTPIIRPWLSKWRQTLIQPTSQPKQLTIKPTFVPFNLYHNPVEKRPWGLMTWWLWVRSLDEAKLLSGVLSPLTFAEACEKSSWWLLKEKLC